MDAVSGTGIAGEDVGDLEVCTGVSLSTLCCSGGAVRSSLLRQGLVCGNDTMRKYYGLFGLFCKLNLRSGRRRSCCSYLDIFNSRRIVAHGFSSEFLPGLVMKRGCALLPVSRWGQERISIMLGFKLPNSFFKICNFLYGGGQALFELGVFLDHLMDYGC